MIAYPDTSFLCSVYMKQIHTPAALAYREAMTEPLHFTRLLDLNFSKPSSCKFGSTRRIAKRDTRVGRRTK